MNITAILQYISIFIFCVFFIFFLDILPFLVCSRELNVNIFKWIVCEIFTLLSFFCLLILFVPLDLNIPIYFFFGIYVWMSRARMIYGIIFAKLFKWFFHYFRDEKWIKGTFCVFRNLKIWKWFRKITILWRKKFFLIRGFYFKWKLRGKLLHSVECNLLKEKSMKSDVKTSNSELWKPKRHKIYFWQIKISNYKVPLILWFIKYVP